MSRPASAAAGTAPPIAFIEALRAAACLLVVYCHVVAGRSETYGYDWWPYAAITRFVVGPLDIIQNFGFFGVALFFLISGFIITHAARRETRAVFVVKRICRIYPPLIVVVLATVALAWVDHWLTGIPNATMRLDRFNVFWSALALNAAARSEGVLPVVWTLTIELVFYAHVLAVLPLLRRRPFLATCVFIAWPVVLIRVCFLAGVGYLAPLVEWLPLFAIGMAIYYGWLGLFSTRLVALLTVAAWCVLVHDLTVVQPFNLAHPTNFIVQAFYVLVVFLAGLWAWRERSRNPGPVRFFADISYSLYLIHYPFGVLAMDRLYPRLGFTLAVLASFGVIVALSALSHRWIERPAQGLARWLVAARIATPTPEHKNREAISGAVTDTDRYAYLDH